MRYIVWLVELIFLSPGLFVLALCTYGLWRGTFATPLTCRQVNVGRFAQTNTMRKLLS